MRRHAAALRLRQAVSLLLLLGLLGFLVGVAGSARLAPADFAFNNFAEVSTLDPATVTGVPEGRVLRAIFEGLATKDPETLEPVPGMAESWEVSADGLVYTFHLRPGARWTNGEPVTAHDFVYSWERFLSPRTAAQYAYQLWYVKGAKAYSTEVDDSGGPRNSFDTVGVRALDERTLEVELEAPTPYFLSLVAFYPLFPVSRTNIEEARRRWPETWEVEWLKPEILVTNGPFRVAERRVNDRIRLVKNHDYWDAENVAFETIDVLAVNHVGTGLNLYMTGEVHWIDQVPANLIPRLLPREDFDPTPYLGSYYYRVNVKEPPLDDVRVRKALALSIDRRAITGKVTKAGQQPAWSFVPPGLTGYEPAPMEGAPAGDSLEGYAELFAANVRRAKELFAEAGYGPGGSRFPTIEIHYNTNETHRDVAEVVADTWSRELGVRVKLLNQEWKVYLDTQNALDYQVSRSAWIGDYPDPNTFLDMFVTGGENNKTGWGNERFDELIAEAAVELDAERRMRLFHDAEEILMEELPILPVYFYVTQNIASPRLGGFHENLQDEQWPKYFYWKSDEELAADRALRTDGQVPVEASGPPAGLYPPSGEVWRPRAAR